MPDIKEGETDAESGDAFDHGADDFDGFADAHGVAKLVAAGIFEVAGFVLFSGERFDHANSREGFLHNHHHGAGFVFFVATCAADFAAVNDDGDEADGKKDETPEGKFPIDIEEGEDGEEDREGLGDDIATDAGEGLLGHAGVVIDALEELACATFSEEIEGLREDMAEEFGPNIDEQFEANPGHIVGIEIRENASGDDHCGDEGADPYDAFDIGASWVGVLDSGHGAASAGEDIIEDFFDD